MNLNNLRLARNMAVQRNNQALMSAPPEPLNKAQQVFNKMPAHIKMQMSGKMMDDKKKNEIENIDDIIKLKPPVNKVRNYFKKLVNELSENYDIF